MEVYFIMRSRFLSSSNRTLKTLYLNKCDDINDEIYNATGLYFKNILDNGFELGLGYGSISKNHEYLYENEKHGYYFRSKNGVTFNFPVDILNNLEEWTIEIRFKRDYYNFPYEKNGDVDFHSISEEGYGFSYTEDGFYQMDPTGGTGGGGRPEIDDTWNTLALYKFVNKGEIKDYPNSTHIFLSHGDHYIRGLYEGYDQPNFLSNLEYLRMSTNVCISGIRVSQINRYPYPSYCNPDELFILD